MRLGLSLGWSRRVGFINGAAILLLLHITLTLLGAAKADEIDSGGGSGNGIVRRAMSFAHALRVRRANFAHALRIKRGGRLSGYTHALRIKKSPSSFALRIKKGDQLGGSGGEEDDYYDNYNNVPDSEYYTGADSDNVITGDTAQYNNMQKRDMNIGRRAAFAHALRIKKRSSGSPDWGGSTRGLYWLTTTGVPVALQPQQSLIDKYQYYAMGGPVSLEPTEATPPLQNKYRIYRDRKSSRFNSHVLRVK